MSYRDRWRKNAMAIRPAKPSEKELKETFGEKEYQRIAALMSEKK